MAQATELLDQQPYILTDRNNCKETPLHWLAIEDEIEGVQLLLARGADPNTLQHGGDCPLADACGLGLVEMTKLLLAHGADPNLRNPHGQGTPLHYAAWHAPNADVIDLLLAAGADMNARNNLDETPIFCAVFTGNRGATARLLENGAETAMTLSFGATTVLHRAVDQGEASVLELLLTAGMDPNVRDSQGDTPLHIAVRRNSPDIARLLLAAGADPGLTDQFGNPAAEWVPVSADAEKWRKLLRRE